VTAEYDDKIDVVAAWSVDRLNRILFHRRPMISIRKPVNPFPGMLAAKASELTPKLKVTAASYSTDAFGSRTEIRK
jgi:hypothetical protein